MFMVMKRYAKAGYYEMVLSYGKCGLKDDQQQWFLEGPHHSHQTILTDLKRLKETGCVTCRARCEPAMIGRHVQTDEVLAYALAYQKCCTREISEHCVLSKSQFWKILSELGAHPYRPKPRRILLDAEAARRYTWCNFVMNQKHVQPAILAGIVWTDETHAFHGMVSTVGRAPITGGWKILDILYDVRNQMWFTINFWCSI